MPAESQGNRIRVLLERGVRVVHPDSVWVDPSVQPENIAPDVTIHPGCRITGAATSIGPGCELGAEAPLTLDGCQLGHRVALKGGYASGATFLDGSNVGSGAHIRSGTVLEEEAGGAHAVGLKQTILLPFVTLGSLINFCDCLMGGGTSRKNHSEVGSSYIHFNYTPHQDKATPSLIGDVPRGVMLDQPPIFLGGQGGLVGPARIAFGTVIPAGAVCRQDVLEPGTLVCPRPPQATVRPYSGGTYGAVFRTISNNIHFMGNLVALQAWYEVVRPRFADDPYRRACLQGARAQVQSALDERRRRLGEMMARLPASVEALRKSRDARLAPVLREQDMAVQHWPRISDGLDQRRAPDSGVADCDAFLTGLDKAAVAGLYIESLQKLPEPVRAAGTKWLEAVVASVTAPWDNVVGRGD